MTVDAKRKLVFLAPRPARLRRHAARPADRPLHHRRQGPVEPEDRHLPVGPGRPHGDLHQRLPVPVVGRPGRHRHAGQQPGLVPAAGVLAEVRRRAGVGHRHRATRRTRTRTRRRSTSSASTARPTTSTASTSTATASRGPPARAASAATTPTARTTTRCRRSPRRDGVSTRSRTRAARRRWSTPTQDDFFGYFDHNAQHITQKVGNYATGDLLYITNENIITCSQAGELKVVSLAGSYDGEGWSSTPQNPFRLNLVGHWTPWGKAGSATTGSCSAHWFTVNGNMVVQAWYGQGTRFLDMSDPANPTQVGYFRVPSGTTGVTSRLRLGDVLAQRLRLRRRLQPRHRRPEVRRHDHRHAQHGDLLGRLRRREGHLHRDGGRDRRAARCRRR